MSEAEMPPGWERERPKDSLREFCIGRAWGPYRARIDRFFDLYEVSVAAGEGAITLTADCDCHSLEEACHRAEGLVREMSAWRPPPLPAPQPPPDPSRGTLPFPTSADRGHAWETDEDGEVRYQELGGYCHAGPRCTRCGYWFCQHCHADGPPEECDGEPACARPPDEW